MAKSYTEEEIRVIAQSALGKTFGEIQNKIKTNYEELSNESNSYIMEETYEYGNKENKAYFGHIFEKDVYDYEINSKSSPDFEDAGIELKVTPYKKNKNNTLSAKERLVLNIINYMTEYKNSFYSSHFWYKNNKIQIVWYLYEKNKKKEELKVTHELLYTFPKEDLPIIIKDWEYIIEKIKNGKAHELSEADTMYLGACTKGANKNSLRDQPFSNIKAMQRAFCLKTSYMTSLVRKYIGNYADVEKVLKNTTDSFEMFINRVIDKYKGKSQKELMSELKIETTSKSVFSMIINRMFKVKSNLRETEEFTKANIIPKTIRVEETGTIKESMSFPSFKFGEVMNTDFEDSDLKEELETTKFMFFIFQKENGEYIFKGIKLWNMPEKIIEAKIKNMYVKTQEIIKTGNIVRHIDNKGRRITNFPGINDNGVCHVRPHGRDAEDTFPLPVKDKLTGVDRYTKQCFWLNSKYIKEIISEFLY